MKLIAIGDSITKGTYTAVGDNAPKSVSNPCFSEIIKQELGYDEYINYGMNGISYCSLSPVNSDFALTKRVDSFESGDLIIVAAGTNDFGTNVPLGLLSDIGDVSFCGAVREVLQKIKQKNKLVFVVTPIPRMDEQQNGLGNSLSEYREAIEYIAQELGLFVIKGDQIPIRPDYEVHKLMYIYDGTHLNENGHKLYAQYLLKEIMRKVG